MSETLVVRTFSVDASDDKIASDLSWKIGRLYPWLFAKDVPVCFLGVGRGWRRFRQNGSFSSHAALKAIPFDGRVTNHVNQLLAWITNFIDILRIALKSTSSPLTVLAHTPQFGLAAAPARVLLPLRLLFVVCVLGNVPMIG